MIAIAMRQAHSRAAAIDRLREVEPHAVDGASAEDMAADAELFEVLEGGRVVGVVAVRVEGDGATITAATASGLATWRHLAELERALHARGVRRLGVCTRRPGLVRELLRRGYRIACADMVKGLEHGTRTQ